MADSKKASGASKTVALNRKARYEYTIADEFECGLVLLGTEVKMLRAGSGVNITDAYAGEKNGELWLLNAQINPYTFRQPSQP